MTDRLPHTHGPQPHGSSHPARAPWRRRAGFTLVELLIVVVILSILAAVAIPQLNSERTEAVVSALAANVNLVTMTIEFQHQLVDEGTWPEAIDPDWFANRRFPSHPDKPDGVAEIEVVRQSGTAHPASKVLSSASAGAYWYNTATGAFRARVTDQGGSGPTLEMYNRVNQSSLDSLSTRDDGGQPPAGELTGSTRPPTPPALSLGG